MDLDGRKRSYAATAYYSPAAKRLSLTVLTGVLVEQILITNSSHNPRVTTTGVQYSADNNTKSSTVQAKREVILCAGSIESPQIWELSGIGNHLLKWNGTVYQPGCYKLDENDVGDRIKQNLQSEYHPTGTCVIMLQDEGGVVDAKFKVYGTENLRVVDASVFPLLSRGNLQTLVYAIAERAAEFIAEDGKG
jgi:choline dehydrogenase-like flavoprotein